MSTTEKPQAVHKTVVGVCQSVEMDSATGWHKFNISHDGSQYPLKLSTKKPDLIALAQAVGKQTATWGYLESDGNPNPNKPGTFYKNRYLDSVAPLGLDQPEAQSMSTDFPGTPRGRGDTVTVITDNVPIEEQSAAPHPAEQADAPPPPVDWDAKDLRRHRQAAVAISVSSFDGDPTASEAGIFARAERIVKFVYQDASDLIPASVDPEDIPFHHEDRYEQQ